MDTAALLMKPKRVNAPFSDSSASHPQLSSLNG